MRRVIKYLSEEKVDAKYIMILLSLVHEMYSSILPISLVRSEAKKLRVPVIELCECTMDEIEEYLSPLKDCHSPPLHLMMMLARKEHAQNIRSLID